MDHLTNNFVTNGVAYIAQELLHIFGGISRRNPDHLQGKELKAAQAFETAVSRNLHTETLDTDLRSDKYLVNGEYPLHYTVQKGNSSGARAILERKYKSIGEAFNEFTTLVTSVLAKGSSEFKEVASDTGCVEAQVTDIQAFVASKKESQEPKDLIAKAISEGQRITLSGDKQTLTLGNEGTVTQIKIAENSPGDDVKWISLDQLKGNFDDTPFTLVHLAAAYGRADVALLFKELLKQGNQDLMGAPIARSGVSAHDLFALSNEKLPEGTKNQVVAIKTFVESETSGESVENVILKAIAEGKKFELCEGGFTIGEDSPVTITVTKEDKGDGKVSGNKGSISKAKLFEVFQGQGFSYPDIAAAYKNESALSVFNSFFSKEEVPAIKQFVGSERGDESVEDVILKAIAEGKKFALGEGDTFTIGEDPKVTITVTKEDQVDGKVEGNAGSISRETFFQVFQGKKFNYLDVAAAYKSESAVGVFNSFLSEEKVAVIKQFVELETSGESVKNVILKAIAEGKEFKLGQDGNTFIIGVDPEVTITVTEKDEGDGKVSGNKGSISKAKLFEVFPGQGFNCVHVPAAYGNLSAVTVLKSFPYEVTEKVASSQEPKKINVNHIQHVVEGTDITTRDLLMFALGEGAKLVRDTQSVVDSISKYIDDISSSTNAKDFALKMIAQGARCSLNEDKSKLTIGSGKGPLEITIGDEQNEGKVEENKAQISKETLLGAFEGGFTLSHVAARFHNISAIIALQSLLEEGETWKEQEVKGTEVSGEKLLVAAWEQKRKSGLREAFLPAIKHMMRKDHQGLTALDEAILSGQTQIFDLFVKTLVLDENYDGVDALNSGKPQKAFRQIQSYLRKTKDSTAVKDLILSKASKGAKFKLADKGDGNKTLTVGRKVITKVITIVLKGVAKGNDEISLDDLLKNFDGEGFNLLHAACGYGNGSLISALMEFSLDGKLMKQKVEGNGATPISLLGDYARRNDPLQLGHAQFLAYPKLLMGAFTLSHLAWDLASHLEIGSLLPSEILAHLPTEFVAKVVEAVSEKGAKVVEHIPEEVIAKIVPNIPIALTFFYLAPTIAKVLQHLYNGRITSALKHALPMAIEFAIPQAIRFGHVGAHAHILTLVMRIYRTVNVGLGVLLGLGAAYNNSHRKFWAFRNTVVLSLSGYEAARMLRNDAQSLVKAGKVVYGAFQEWNQARMEAKAALDAPQVEEVDQTDADSADRQELQETQIHEDLETSENQIENSASDDLEQQKVDQTDADSADRQELQETSDDEVVVGQVNEQQDLSNPLSDDTGIKQVDQADADSTDAQELQETQIHEDLETSENQIENPASDHLEQEEVDQTDGDSTATQEVQETHVDEVVVGQVNEQQDSELSAHHEERTDLDETQPGLFVEQQEVDQTDAGSPDAQELKETYVDEAVQTVTTETVGAPVDPENLVAKGINQHLEEEQDASLQTPNKDQ